MSLYDSLPAVRQPKDLVALADEYQRADSLYKATLAAYDAALRQHRNSADIVAALQPDLVNNLNEVRSKWLSLHKMLMSYPN